MIIKKTVMVAFLALLPLASWSASENGDEPVFDISSLIVYEVVPGETLAKTLKRWAGLSEKQLALKSNGYSGVFDYRFSTGANLGQDLKAALERLLKAVNDDLANKSLETSACIYTQSPSTLLVKVNQYECP